MPFEPREITSDKTTEFPEGVSAVPGPRWLPVTEHDCGFEADSFFAVVTNLVQNPNITSSHLFRADILYDSQDGELENTQEPRPAPDDLEEHIRDYTDLPGFELQRTIVRRFVPRNPTLDKPIEQTCLFLKPQDADQEPQTSLVIMRPNTTQPEALPWYHPAVQAIAYSHSWTAASQPLSSPDQSPPQGKVSVHYQLFPAQILPLDTRLTRTALHLLRAAYKHGEGHRTGYVKKGAHDQLLAQKRVQDRYAALKQRHARRLCDAWVEQTEPSKHVFEDLSIAAYLIELWRDMYAAPDAGPHATKPPFPGFVDIGCGNGVLTEVLLLEGYAGRGFDARRRKTWAVLSPAAQANLHQTLCVPQPLFDLCPPERDHADPEAPAPRGTLRSLARGLLSSLPAPSPPPQQPGSGLAPPKGEWHNGLFAPGTFIVSNHADELTPWTPLLACLTASPFLAIPCCSHNLSGARFRAPSAFNSNSADAAAPAFFDAHKARAAAKSVPISVPGYGPGGQPLADAVDGPADGADGDSAEPEEGAPRQADHAAERGSLAALSPAARSKQPSAYASLCAWATHLTRAAGFEPEADMLRIPSTRNAAIVARRLRLGAEGGGGELRELAGLDAAARDASAEARRERVMAIVRREGADGAAWVKRCEAVLTKATDGVHMD